MKAKAATTAFLGAAALALWAAACSNPAAQEPGPAKGTGRVTLSVSIQGDPAARSVSPSRTVAPSFVSAFTDYVLDFKATSGGQDKSATVNAGSDLEVTGLAVGTYTVTVTARVSGGYASARGSAGGVVVTDGANTPVQITMGPVTGDGTGTLSYDLTTPAGASGSLAVTPAGGGASETVSLPAGQQTSGSIATLAPGTYTARVSLSKNLEKAGFVEVVYIYRGLTSALPATEFTPADFYEVVVVSDVDLTGLFSAPAAGNAVPTGGGTEAQYAWIVAWKLGAEPFAGNVFSGQTAYTAVLTLTPVAGYTFEDFTGTFAYTDAASVSQTLDSGEGTATVTIVFQATGPLSGSSSKSVTLAYDPYADIVIANGGKTINSNGGVILSIEGYTGPVWYLDGVEQAESGLSLVLSGASLSLKTHRVSVQAVNDGKLYSGTTTVTVVETAAVEPTALANLATHLAGLSTNTPENPHTVLLERIDVKDSTKWAALRTALDSIIGQNKYIHLYLRECYATGDTISGLGNSVPGSTYFNHITRVDNSPVVGITLPPVPKITGSALYGSATLRTVVIPAEAGTNLLAGVFQGCTAINRIIIEGTPVTNDGTFPSFPSGESLAAVYIGTGTYVRNDTVWSKQP